MIFGSGAAVRSQDRLSLFCIGDSRCVGNFSTDRGGYRYGFFTRLQTKLGYDPRLCGSNFWNSFVLPCCAQSGDRVADCLTKVTAQSPLFLGMNLVLIDIGVNDAIVGTTPATIISGVNSIIDQVRTYSPNAIVIVTKTVDYNGFTSLVTAYNSALGTAMALRGDYAVNPAIGKTSLYDANTDIGPYSVTYFANDGHNNAAGYDIIAAGYYNKIASLL